MLISSKFKDYYDSVLSYGVDKAVVYDRKTEEIDVTKNYQQRYQSSDPDLPYVVSMKINKVSVDARFYVIGFCGKVYPVVELTETYSRTSKVYCFDFETLRKYVRHAPYQYDYFGSSFHVGQDVEMKSYFNPDTWSHLLGVFRKYNVPAFYLRKDGHIKEILTLNPQLKSLGFHKLKDTATAFQELYMFISGVLGVPEKRVIHISDKVLAAKKGHGDKYSFRKPPKKPKG